MPHPPLLIIGAGPAGLGTAIGFGQPCTVIERQAQPGGLAASIELDGAVFDLGGHSFWTPYPEVRQLVFSAIQMVEQRRNAQCWFDGTWVDYPFQRHFETVPDPRVRDECRAGLAGARNGKEPAHFGEHLLQKFGSGITHHFLGPYNEKLWGRSLERLATDWTKERVAAPSQKNESLLGVSGRRSPLQENTCVAYPARGGFGEIFRALARRVPDLRLGQAVATIDVEARTLLLQDGTILPWSHLVSSMPLPELLARIPAAPARITECAAGLEYVSLYVVLVVVEGPVDRDLQRAYVADPAILPHKIALNHNSSPELRRRPRHGIIAEVSFSETKAVPEEDLGPRVVRDLLKLGLLRREQDALSTQVVRVKYGYPVPTHDRAKRVAMIREWLALHDISTIGRFGAWDYANSDKCLHDGLVLGRMLAQTNDRQPFRSALLEEYACS